MSETIAPELDRWAAEVHERTLEWAKRHFMIPSGSQGIELVVSFKTREHLLLHGVSPSDTVWGLRWRADGGLDGWRTIDCRDLELEPPS